MAFGPLRRAHPRIKFSILKYLIPGVKGIRDTKQDVSHEGINMKPPGVPGRRIAAFPHHLSELIKRSGAVLLAVGAALAVSVVIVHGGSSASSQSAVHYTVPPMRISPDHGVLIHDNPVFMEPALVRTEHGLATAFIENAENSSATPPRVGWTCASTTGKTWSCSQLSLGQGGADWADPWMADTRGDPCTTYGKGITLAALRRGPNDILEPIAYYSLDFGKTWIGPESLPWSDNISMPIADGTKLIYTGRTYLAWRDFTFLTGEYISQLQTVNGKCSWGNPIRLTTFTGSNGTTLSYDDGSDHPRLAATPVSGELAARGSFGDDLLTFHRYNSALEQEYSSIIGPSSYPEDQRYFCPNSSDCPHLDYDLGQTLLFVPSNGQYIAVFQRNDVGGGNADGIGLWFSRSVDNGMTWAAPAEVAGPSISGSYVTMQPTMTYDKATGDALLAYLEVPNKNSYAANVQLTILAKGASNWIPPQTLRTFQYGVNSSDYFTVQAAGGVVHVVHSLPDSSGSGSFVEYFAARYTK
jgi:hypothetical protein